MRYLAIVGVVLVLAGCGAKDPLTSTETQVIWPLKVGNHWEYKFNQYNSDYVQPISSGVYIYDVLGTVQIGTETWSLMQVFDSTRRNLPGDSSVYIYHDTMYVMNRADGLWSRSSVISQPYMAVKFPVHLGETYQQNPGLPGSPVVEVASLDEQVRVPAGTFSCYHYIMHENQWNFDWSSLYCRPNVGIVQQVVRDLYDWNVGPTGGWYIEMSMALSAYDLK